MRKKVDAEVLIAIIFFSVVVIGLTYESIKSNTEVDEMEKHGVCTLGIITEVSRNTYFYSFQYHGVSYNDRFTYHYFHKGDLVFVLFLPTDPAEQNMAMRDAKVPPCLDISNVPKEGWKKMPTSCH